MSEFTATPGQFMHDLQRWMPLNNPDPVSSTATHLSVATFNVWYATEYFEQRCQAILALLELHQPDLIALQEVSPAFLDQILKTPWIQAAYHLSDIYSASVDPYGVLLLSRYPILEWQFLRLPSAMGRYLVTAQAFINDQTTTLASVHLESQSYSAPTRAKQLARIFPYLAAEQHVILTGDFNFCSSWEENQRLDSRYQDIWPKLHPQEPGFTEDTERNTMRLLHTGKRKGVRFDRMLLRSSHPGWEAQSVTLIGTEAISSATPDIFPSDHFGLVGRFCWQTE